MFPGVIESMIIQCLFSIIFAVLILFPTAPAEALEIYSYVDKRGVRHLTDRRKHSGFRLIRRYPDGLHRVGGSRDEKRFHPIIKAASKRTGLSSALLRAVIRTESAFNPKAVSSKGAVGLMQLMPSTARQYGVTDLTDPAANVNAGARHLRGLLERYNDLKLSLAAYNAGEGAVARYGNTIPPYPETQQYVVKVLRYYQKYRETM